MGKINFYDRAENACEQGEETEEEMVAEYIENEQIIQEYEERILENNPPLEEIVPTLMDKISSYLVDGSCCDQKCCESWAAQDLERHTKDLSELSRYEKKIVLLTVLRTCLIYSDKTRYSEQRQRIRFKFSYAPFGSMCANAFRLLFDIRIETFKGLLAHLKTNATSIVPPVHGNNGKKAEKINLLSSKGISERVIQFLLELGHSEGEYSAGRRVKQGNTKEDKNPDILWLPACYTRSILLRMYEQQYPKDSISRTAFCLLLKNETELKHIQIRSPRTDMCDFCEFQKRKIAGIKPHDETIAEKLVDELKIHQDAYRGERSTYNTEREQSKKDRDNHKKAFSQRMIVSNISV